MATPGTPITEVIGVYHADGGPIGEARYVIGKLLGTAHCALCDVTHSPVRRKPAWNAMVKRLGLRVTLLHLNEMPDDVAGLVRATGTPVVLGRRADGSLIELLAPDDLEQQRSSVAVFEMTLRGALDRARPPGSAEDGPAAPAER